jgi:hypothetical protein
MKLRLQPFAEELASYVFHPLRIMRICNNYRIDFEEYVEIVG